MIINKKKRWWIATVKYSDSEGKNKKESYILDSSSYSDAEEEVTKQVAPFVSDNFEIVDLKTKKYAEIISSEDGSDDRWFLVKSAMTIFDEKKGVEKQKNMLFLVQGKDIRKTLSNRDKVLKNSLGDFFDKSVVDTDIMDVFVS